MAHWLETSFLELEHYSIMAKKDVSWGLFEYGLKSRYSLIQCRFIGSMHPGVGAEAGAGAGVRGGV